MRTNLPITDHTKQPHQSLKEQTWTWWIQTKAPHFFKAFKAKMERDALYDPKWQVYYQNYGLFFKCIQSVISEFDKTDIISAITLDKKLKKTIKKYNKKIKHGKNK